MKYDFNSYEIFISGSLNPNRHTKYDEKARHAEKQFQYDLANYKEAAVVFIKVKLQEILNDPNKIEGILNTVDYIKLGFKEGEKVSIAIDPEEIDDEEKIELRIKSQEKEIYPTIESKKTKFFDKELLRISRSIRKNIKKTTLGFDSEEKVNAYISQQYQFAHFYYDEFERLGKSSSVIVKHTNKLSKKKKPMETNTLIFWKLSGDILNLIRFLEDSYPFYLKSRRIPIDIVLPKFPKMEEELPKQKRSKWKTILNIDNFELKPNFAGIGINLNELIKQWKKKS